MARVLLGLILLLRTACPLPHDDDDLLLAFEVGPKLGLPRPSRHFVRAFRDSPVYRFVAQAETHSHTGRLHDAARAYEHALSSYALDVEEEAPLQLALGGVYAELSLAENAERAYLAASESRRLAHLAHWALGSVFAREGHFELAVHELELAVALRPGWFPALHNLGSLHIIRGDIDAGLLAFDAAVSALSAMGHDLPVLAELEDARAREAARVGSAAALASKTGGVVTNAVSGSGGTGGSAGGGLMGTPKLLRRTADLESHLIHHILRVFKVTPPPSSSPRGAHAKQGAGQPRIAAVGADGTTVPLIGSSTGGVSGSAAVGVVVGAGGEADGGSGSDKHALLGSDAISMGVSLWSFLQRLSQLDLGSLHRGLAYKLLDVGAFEEGLLHTHRAVALSPTHNGQLKVLAALALPVSYSSMDDVWTARARVARNVRDALQDRTVSVHPERLHEMYMMTYLLPYSGLPAHLLIRDIARYIASCEDPVLDVTSPHIGTYYARALAHATGDERFERLAPPLSSSSTSRPPQLWHWPVVAQPTPRRNAAVVRVGLLTFQAFDCPVGHLMLRIARHLRGYGRAVAASTKAAATMGKRTGAVGGKGRGSCMPLEGPSEGGGTLPRYLLSGSCHDAVDVVAGGVRVMHNSSGIGGGRGGEGGDRLGSWESPRVWTSKGGGDAGGGGGGSGGDVLDGGVMGDPLEPWGHVSIPGVSSFETTLFRMARWGDSVTEWLMNETTKTEDVFKLRHPGSGAFDPDLVRKAIAAAHVDVLVVVDTGLQAESYSLLFARSAPVQVVLWGSDAAQATTLGLPDTVDYFVLGDGAAADDAQSFLHEQSVRLGDTGQYLTRLKPPRDEDIFSAVSSHGLLEGSHLYLIPAPLSALHPHFDDVILGILNADAQGEVMLLYEAGQELWLATTRSRLLAHPRMSGGAYERLRFTEDPINAIIGRRASPERLALMAAVEVVIDTFPVGIGCAALDALEAGTPVVTFPAKQSQQRLAAAALKRLGLAAELASAATIAEYVANAVRVACDAPFRRGLRRRIAARAPLLEWPEHFSEGRQHAASLPSASDKHREGMLAAVAAAATKAAAVAADAAAASAAALSGDGRADDAASMLASTAAAARDAAVAAAAAASTLTEEADELASDAAWLESARSSGYGEPSAATLHDWVSFLGTVGRPWAEDRMSTLADMRAQTHSGGAAAEGGAGREGGGSKTEKSSSSARARTREKKRAAAAAKKGG